MSRADSRVRSPGTFACARCPAARSALDTVPEAYHNPAAVWWGAFAPSACMLTALSQTCTISLGIGPIIPADTTDKAALGPGVAVVDRSSPWLIAR